MNQHVSVMYLYIQNVVIRVFSVSYLVFSKFPLFHLELSITGKHRSDASHY